MKYKTSDYNGNNGKYRGGSYYKYNSVGNVPSIDEALLNDKDNFTGLNLLKDREDLGLISGELLSGRVVRYCRAVTSDKRVRFNEGSSSITVRVTGSFFRLDVFFDNMNCVASRIIRGVLGLTATTPVLLTRIIYSNSFRALKNGGSRMTIGVCKSVRAALSRFTLGTNLRRSTLNERLVTSELIVMKLTIKVRRSTVFTGNSILLYKLSFRRSSTIVNRSGVISLNFNFLIDRVSVSRVPRRKTISGDGEVNGVVFHTFTKRVGYGFLFSELRSARTYSRIEVSNDAVLSNYDKCDNSRLVRSYNFIARSRLTYRALRFRRFLSMLLTKRAVTKGGIIKLRNLYRFNYIRDDRGWISFLFFVM